MLYKYMLYFITKLMLGIYWNNAIVEVPRSGTYFLYVYFSNAHPLFYVINLITIYTICFIMFLIKLQ